MLRPSTHGTGDRIGVQSLHGELNVDIYIYIYISETWCNTESNADLQMGKSKSPNCEAVH